jgi:hypothetical protein
VIPLRARRLVAALLAGTGAVALAVGALRQDLPLSDSLVMAGRFWRAGPRGRLLNAPGIARDAPFAAEALRAAATWPLDEDVIFSAGRDIPPEQRERLRRKAAYLLAPRRVRLEQGDGSELRLRPAKEEGR